MKNRRLTSRFASTLLVLHGLVEVAGLVFLNSTPMALISFGGLTGLALERNMSAIAMYGVLWGIVRFVAAWGAWSFRKWAMVLGMILSIVTLIAAITIIPAGVTDTLFAIPVLVLLLYAWFGNGTLEI